MKKKIKSQQRKKDTEKANQKFQKGNVNEKFNGQTEEQNREKNQ